MFNCFNFVNNRIYNNNKKAAFYNYFKDNLEEFYFCFFDNNSNYISYKNNIFSLNEKGKKKIISENLIDLYSKKSSGLYYTTHSQKNQIFYIEGNIDTINSDGKKTNNGNEIKFKIESEKKINCLNDDDEIIFNNIDYDKGPMEYDITEKGFVLLNYNYIQEKAEKKNGIFKLEFEKY
jgi:hypothetical protein